MVKKDSTGMRTIARYLTYDLRTHYLLGQDRYPPDPFKTGITDTRTSSDNIEFPRMSHITSDSI